MIDPLSRYQYAKQLKAASTPYPAWVDILLALHDKYWPSEAAMAEGNPKVHRMTNVSIEEDAQWRRFMRRRPRDSRARLR